MAQQLTALSHFVVYSAAPEDDRFLSTDSDGLREILAELDRVDPSDCGGDLYDIVHDDMTLLRDSVIPAAERGVEVLVAQDEDGYYFARRVVVA